MKNTRRFEIDCSVALLSKLDFGGGVNPWLVARVALDLTGWPPLTWKKESWINIIVQKHQEVKLSERWIGMLLQLIINLVSVDEPIYEYCWSSAELLLSWRAVERFSSLDGWNRLIFCFIQLLQSRQIQRAVVVSENLRSNLILIFINKDFVEKEGFTIRKEGGPWRNLQIIAWRGWMNGSWSVGSTD